MKVTKYPKSNTIKCIVCGCIYEYEQGDRIDYTAMCSGETVVCTGRTLSCPVCGYDNKCDCINYDD